MGAVAWGALLVAIVLAATAVGLERWRRTLVPTAPTPRLDLAGLERAQRAEDLAFDGIVGALLLHDPAFADSADRLARRDDGGPAA